ncbi:pentatricopeptide repeat-containing protein At1g62260, mitochondrial-like [Salvia hispanica]|uniref:pentatricopeptide repeat-containing protein At1g62260, mitochondrial-like n=1 Tax=Salvia hispanica TaxID=49212 RepID=UPI0020094D0A|nr:pentatricopeptide repeat-containing protein At1g62260, mitochondrial-like [Salvia hispanica]
MLGNVLNMRIVCGCECLETIFASSLWFSSPYCLLWKTPNKTKKGKRHADCVLRARRMRNLLAVTSMIVGYAARDEMGEARSLYDLAAERNFVMWIAVISGYVRLQRCEDVFALFCEYATVDRQG